MTTGTITPPPQAPPARKRTTHAQQLILAIGIPVLLVLIGWSGLSIVASVARGSEPVSVSIPAASASGATVRADLRGDSTVRLVPGATPHLSGTIGYSLERPRVNTGGGSVSYRCLSLVGSCSLDATLSLPPASPVSLSSGTGDLSVSGGPATRPSVSLSTTAGDLTSPFLAARQVTLTSTTGDITADSISASRVSAKSATGDIRLVLTKVPVSLNVTGRDNDITIVLPPSAAGYNVQARSNLGDVSVSSGIRRNSSGPVISVTSTTGDITVSSSNG
jgi:hypothetical protein